MKNVITVAQIIIGIILSGLILLQAKGTGLGRSFGGVAYHSKRGVENLIFKLTIAFSIAFVVASVANQLIP